MTTGSHICKWIFFAIYNFVIIEKMASYWAEKNNLSGLGHDSLSSIFVDKTNEETKLSKLFFR